MISYDKFSLDNGLRIVVHHDPNTPLATVNILYDVGSRDESESRTGFAHLFEHLMFEGSVNIPDYDEHVHLAGGESNAFTSSDMTNYYITLPVHNIETAFWLESDRMLSLAFSEEALAVQKGVVCEEFKEHYINQPYGDWMHKMRALCFTTHPYKWLTIGKELSHIEQATLSDVRAFFFQHYRPNNAILCVAGNVTSEQVRQLAQKWFGDIPPSEKPYHRQLPAEPAQTTFHSQHIYANVPIDALYMAFHIGDRLSPSYHPTAFICDILSSGASGRLYQHLVKDQTLFSSLHAYSWDEHDPGLLYIEGKLNKGVTLESAETAICHELEQLCQMPVSEDELGKVRNKVEAAIVFNEVGLSDRAFSLAYYELLGDIDEINNEIDKYLRVTAADIQQTAQQIFSRENCSVLYYHAQPPSEAAEQNADAST